MSGQALEQVLVHGDQDQYPRLGCLDPNEGKEQGKVQDKGWVLALALVLGLALA